MKLAIVSDELYVEPLRAFSREEVNAIVAVLQEEEADARSRRLGDLSPADPLRPDILSRRRRADLLREVIFKLGSRDA